MIIQIQDLIGLSISQILYLMDLKMLEQKASSEDSLSCIYEEILHEIKQKFR